MARCALYHYFPNGKEQLFEAVINDVDAALHDGITHVVETETSPIKQILAGFDVLLRLATDRIFARIILIEAAGVFPGAWQTGSEYVLLRDALDRAVNAGELRPIPRDAATSTIYGAARRAADLVARADNPVAVAAECSDVLLDGMRADVTQHHRATPRGRERIASRQQPTIARSPRRARSEFEVCARSWRKRRCRSLCR